MYLLLASKHKMKKEEIIPFDLKRMLLGQAPPEFLLEVLIRTLIVYLVAIIIVRLLGKRMNGQISIIEMSVMVLMGAILSLPMQSPDRGIVQGIVALLTVLFLLRGINKLAFRRPRLEKLIHGEAVVLIKDGILQLDQLKATTISKQQLFGVLRSQQITNLSQVKRLYLEAYGDFSIYHNEKPAPGLSILPPNDKDLNENLTDSGKQACTNCGTVQEVQGPCSNCGQQKWTAAIQ